MSNSFHTIKGDAFDYLDIYKDLSDVCFFIDPPYTIAGKRLYNHFEINHLKLFECVSRLQGHFLMTYDDTQEVREWVNAFNFQFRTIPMQTTHLVTKEELLVSDNFDWL